MKILILTLSTGQGHIQTSKAMCEYFEKQGAECRILDAYKFISPFLSSSVEKFYLLTTQYTPKAFGTVYELLETKKHTPDGKFSFWSAINNAITASKLEKYIERFMPDVVISTHIFCGTVMTYISEKLKGFVNVGIITDFTVHPFWEESKMDYYVTASHLLNLQCEKKGIDKEKICPIGIPVSEKFSHKIDSAEAKKILGIHDKPTVMFMMGSMGFGNMPKTIAEIDALELDFQILCVCGRNAEAKEKIEKQNHKHKVYVYGFADNVDVMMDASDFIITKPGGLSMSESLAKGLPTILINPIPGHEIRNLEFFVNNGISMAVSKTFTIDEAVYQMLCNEWKMKNTKGAVAYIGKPNAVQDIYKLILKAVKGREHESC